MSVLLAVRLINVLGALLLFTMLLILASGQLYRAIYAVAAQAVLLGIAGAVLGAATGNIDLWVIAGITIVVKAILLPWLLIRVVKRINIGRDIEPVIPINVTLLFAAGIVVLAFHLSASLVGIALILLGVLVMASRRKALVQMVGLFASENGIFFTAMAISQGMPLIIEIGVILDVVLGALVMGILVLRVRSSVDTDIADLESLKG
jgi:hydrogenase-4 membrane subunit HyfE